MARLNQNGQAAVTDALFMLMIISGLCVMLFAFTANYGNNLSQHVLRQYTVDYSTDALKTILYSSTPHLSGETLADTNEVDFLLAAVKEDYAENDAITGDVPVTLKNNIQMVMAPVADQFDYFFVIVTPDNMEYIYMFLYKSNFQCFDRDDPRNALPSCENAIGRDLIIKPGPEAHTLYFCDDIDRDKISNLIFLAGESSQSNAPLLLLKWVGGDVKMRTYSAQASLVMWPATLIPQAVIDDLGCTKAPQA
jgi:hypothetical protein